MARSGVNESPLCSASVLSLCVRRKSEPHCVPSKAFRLPYLAHSANKVYETHKARDSHVENTFGAKCIVMNVTTTNPFINTHYPERETRNPRSALSVEPRSYLCPCITSGPRWEEPRRRAREARQRQSDRVRRVKRTHPILRHRCHRSAGGAPASRSAAPMLELERKEGSQGGCVLLRDE